MRLNQSCPSDSFEPLDQAVPEAKIPLLLKPITLPSFLIPSLLHSFISVFLPSFSFSFLTEKNLNWYRKEDFPQAAYKITFISLFSQALHSSHSYSERQLNFPLYLLRVKLCISMLYFLSA